MKNSIDHSADSEAVSAQPIFGCSAAEADAPSGTPFLFHRLESTSGDAIRLPVGIDGETIIDVFGKSSFSALLHGASRYFLEIVQDMAPRDIDSAAETLAHLESWWRKNTAAIAADSAHAKPGIKITAKDVLAALDHGTTGNPRKDTAIDTGMQSVFAHAAEIYLIEGKAPSPGMRGVFEQFRDWLLSIYRRLVALDISLAPDIAAIFFRLLACDIAVEMAQKEVGGDEPVFADAATAGLTEPHYDRLLKLRAQAGQEAKSRLLRQMMEPVRREGQTAYKAEKASVQREVEKEIDATGLYRAIEWMTNRRWLDRETPVPAGDIRLDRAALVARYGIAILEALPRGEHRIYADEGGIDPDIVADLFDLGSADEMVAAMTLAPARADAIAFEVERVMLQRHGDMLIDGSAEERAIAAVHNDRRAEWLAAELKAIIEVAGGGEGLTMGEAKAYALSATAGMEVGDAVDGARFLAAGRRTGMEAARLGDELAQDEAWRDRASRSAAGDADTAPHPGKDERIGKLITAKRRQLLNHAIYAESLEITSEVEKIEAEAESLAHGPAREKLTQAVLHDDGRIDYLGAVDALLDRYGLGGRENGRTGRQDDPRNALRNYILAMKAAGRENELAIPDIVLIGSGRQSYKEITLERFRAVAAALKNVEHAARRAGKLIDADHETDLGETVSGLVYALKRPGPTGPARRERPRLDPAHAADAVLRDIDATAAGPFYQAIKASLDAAASRLAIGKQKAATDLRSLYDVYSARERREMARRRYLPALGQSLSKWDAIAIALNAGNEANRRRLTDSRIEGALNEAGLDAVLASLDARDAGFVQSVWNYLASFRGDIAAREKRVTGIEPQWVEPVPVTIGGIELKGGYYPLAYDGPGGATDLSQALMSGRFVKSQTQAGHGRGHADLAGRPLDLDIAVLHRHVNHLLYDLEFSEALSNAGRLLSDTNIRVAFSDTGRATDFDALQTWLREIGAGEFRVADRICRTARLARKNVTAATLAADLATAISRQAGLSDTIAAVGRGDFVAGLQAASRPGSLDEIAGKSPAMTERKTTLSQEDRGDSGTAWEELACRLSETLRYRFVEVPAWLGSYHHGLRRFGEDETKAVAHADAMVQALPRRNAPLPTSGQTEILRLFIALASYMSARLAISPEAAGGEQDAPPFAPAGASPISLAMDLVAIFMADTVLATAIEAPADSGKWQTFLAAHTGFSVMAALPFIRDGADLGDSHGDAAALANVMRAASPDVQISRRDIPDILAATGLASALPAEEIDRRVADALTGKKPADAANTASSARTRP